MSCTDEIECGFWRAIPLESVPNPFAQMADVSTRTTARTTAPTAPGDVPDYKRLHLLESVHVEKTFHFFICKPHKYALNVENRINSLARLHAYRVTVVGLLSPTEERSGGKQSLYEEKFQDMITFATGHLIGTI